MQSLEDVVVLFDLDGTFADTAGDLAAAMNHALTAAGRPTVAPARVRRLVGHGARAMLQRGFAESGAQPTPSELDGHVDVFLDYYLAHIADLTRPFPHAVEAADVLAGLGAKLTICTNKREGPARRLLETLGLAPRFAGIVGMETAGAAKPDPRPVRRCMELAERRVAVLVGDSDTDIAAATAAGIPCLFFVGGYGPGAAVAGCAGLFGDFRSLPGLVSRAVCAAVTPRPKSAAACR